MVDVIAIWEILFQIIFCYFRLMLLPFNFSIALADVIAND